ncbi:MAG: arginase family protein [Bacilli bacterium]
MKPWRDLTTTNPDFANVALASVALDRNASVGKGARFAPRKLRTLSQHLPPASKDGLDLTAIKLLDLGNIGNNFTSFSKIEQKANDIYHLNKFSVFLGGDHSIAIPLQKAFYQYCIENNKIPAIIHIDAHPDICDVYHGSKFSHACPNFRAIELGYKYEDVKLLGIRGFELQEIDLFKHHPELEVINASTLNEKGMDAIKHFKTHFDDRYLVYLSFDIDAIDPSFVPGTGTPEAFGLSPSLVTKMITDFVLTIPVFVFDIVEISPKLDINDVTSWTALKILYEVFASLTKKWQLKEKNQ